MLGGTIGAVVLQTPRARLVDAARMLKWVFVPPVLAMGARHQENAGMEHHRATRRLARARKRRWNAKRIRLRTKGLELLIDGGEPQVIRHVMENELSARMQRDLAAASVFKSMGGYAPTIGIIGAVMGLIHVMGSLADPSQLGAGIATAFVATIYGIGLANLVFLPIADRLAALVERDATYRSMTIEAILAIAEGEHPRSIELRLRGFVDDRR